MLWGPLPTRLVAPKLKRENRYRYMSSSGKVSRRTPTDCGAAEESSKQHEAGMQELNEQPHIASYMQLAV